MVGRAAFDKILWDLAFQSSQGNSYGFAWFHVCETKSQLSFLWYGRIEFPVQTSAKKPLVVEQWFGLRDLAQFVYHGFMSDFSIIELDKHGFWKPRGLPTQSLHRTAELFETINGKIIIEVGTGIHGEMSGNSMKVWTSKTSAERIIAIDLDPERIEEVRREVGSCSNVELELTDGIEFVEQFAGRIDLLYLDFWVVDEAGEVSGSGRARAYQAAYDAAREKLSRKSLILIDDTDHIHPWKHTFIVPSARQDGFEVLHIGRQTLLMRTS